jgi:hypothetical protein
LSLQTAIVAPASRNRTAPSNGTIGFGMEKLGIG